ncbi:NADH-quinone oxidoreductase subunit K [Stutzerimonas stutzeri]|uniref:Cation:proton antiporter n=1 Tax=Stutzerimonas stutzeri TaxID=316 RepID=A0A2N8R9K8_STUST|nr:NADH-quinone oxidoreductase subunit K [Stutzerimonas stutzeri]MCQ4256146.1 NADH-quinone oxidoreductase subunit K [Stutzerimonas stutzeri]OCX91663.1 MAG: cation:proton antiporter [Pseudomonas sp. CO183]PNF57770.1 cation:proton antiporter [Stutzerimonas stutzeri]
MHLIFALAIAVIAGCSLYLILSRHIVRILLGVTMLSAAINLVIFLSGRIVSNVPAVIRAGESGLPADAANPLPQALVLTAIVIGFSLTAFFAALALQTYRSFGSVDTRHIGAAERLGSPFPATKDRP